MLELILFFFFFWVFFYIVLLLFIEIGGCWFLVGLYCLDWSGILLYNIVFLVILLGFISLVYYFFMDGEWEFGFGVLYYFILYLFYLFIEN